MRFIVPVTLISLFSLLAACSPPVSTIDPPAQNAPLDFGNDPRILRGVWTGTNPDGRTLLLDLDASDPTADGYTVSGSFQLGDEEPVVIEGRAKAAVTVPAGTLSSQKSDPSYGAFTATSVTPGWQLEGSAPEGSPPQFSLQLTGPGMSDGFILTAQAPTPLVGTEWALETLRGGPPLEGTSITLEFSEKPHGGFGGYDGCNYYGARYLADTTTFEIVYGIPTTLIGCAANVETQATAYTAALSDATTYRLLDGRLTFADTRGETILAFVDTEQPPMNPADLLGTDWRLTEMNGERLPPEADITLAFPRARVLRSKAGCVAYYGVYDASGNDIHVGQLSAAYDACAEDEPLEGYEAAYSNYLSTISDFQLDAAGLTIYTRQNDTLVFKAGP